MSNSPTDSLKMLEGKTITRVRIFGVNAVTVETNEGTFEIETEAVQPTHGIYGIRCTEDKDA